MIRLACLHCSRDDCDGIECLAEAPGWTDIREVQTFKESCQTYDDPAEAPPGFSIFDWWTHLSICPECQDL